MRVVILCELFPLVHGTRAIQMSKVARALEQFVGRYGSGDDVLIVSGAGPETGPDAKKWLAGRGGRRECLPYRPECNSWRLTARAAHALHVLAATVSRNAPFVRAARQRVRTIIDDFAPDVLMTVATPLAWHRVGLAVKKEFPELPWTAFFADPRPLGLLPPPFRRREPGNVYKAWLCRRVLERTDAVIGPNSYMLDWMDERLDVRLDGRRYVIPHCGLSAAPDADAEKYRGWLLHVGSLCSGQVTWDLLKAIRSVAHSHPNEFHGLMCVGRVAANVHQMAASLGMEQYVRTVGRVSPERAAGLVAASDATLLADTPLDTGYFLHSKFADYAVNGRPILMVGPPRCPMRDYLEAHGGGLAVTHRQEEIEHALERLFVHRNVPGAQGGTAGTAELKDLARQFSSETVAAKYFQAYREIINGAGHRGRRAA